MAKIARNSPSGPATPYIAGTPSRWSPVPTTVEQAIEEINGVVLISSNQILLGDGTESVGVVGSTLTLSSQVGACVIEAPEGMALPVLTTAVFDALPNIAGRFAYDTTKDKLVFNTGGAVETVTST